jgi:hypothetical protein
MQERELVVVTAVRRSEPYWWEYLQNYSLDGMAIAALILLAAIFRPRLSRWLVQTPIATALLFVGVVFRFSAEALAIWADGIERSDGYGELFGASHREILDWLGDWASPITLALATFFVAARVLRLFASHRVQLEAPPESLSPATHVWRWRFPLSIQALRSFLSQRSRILHEEGALWRMLADPDFNPLGFRVTGALLAGTPAAVLLGVLGILIPGDGQSLASELSQSVYGFVAGTLRPFAVVMSVAMASLVAGWAITLLRPSRARLARQTYLAVDGARVFWLEVLALISLSLAIFVAFDEVRQVAFADWAGQWQTEQVALALGLSDDVAYGLQQRFGDSLFLIIGFAMFCLPFFGLLISRFALIPWSVMAGVGINGFFVRAFGLLIHAIAVVCVIPLVTLPLNAAIQAVSLAVAQGVHMVSQAYGG